MGDGDPNTGENIVKGLVLQSGQELVYSLDAIEDEDLLPGQEKVLLTGFNELEEAENALVFGNFLQEGEALTPGFWNNNQSAWNGELGDDPHNLVLVGDGVLSSEDVLHPAPTNPPDDPSGEYLVPIFGGPYYFELDDLQQLIGIENVPKGTKITKVYDLARNLGAAALNYLNGLSLPGELETLAEDLIGLGPDGLNLDVDDDGIIDFNNAEESGLDGFESTIANSVQGPNGNKDPYDLYEDVVWVGGVLDDWNNDALALGSNGDYLAIGIPSDDVTRVFNSGLNSNGVSGLYA
jgi:hypothetical protein